jgi:Tol biopolymer transport system component
VAIKLLPDYWSRDPDRIRRFELEAQAAAALNHPNIVSIFHVSQHDGTPFIVIELLHGETLRERLSRGPMRLREVIDLGTEMAQGLAAAHTAGIIHRDLKPENLFLTKDGRVKILDFGLAKLAQPQLQGARADGETVTFREDTRPGYVLGTVGYMSPEQVRAEQADARSDIFALGVVLYEMLTGRRAFRKATSAETMAAILNEDPAPISTLSPAIPPGLQRVINRCLMKNPEQRFQNSSDLAFALEAMSDSGNSSAIAIAKAPSSRWPWASVAVAVIAVAATTAIWWSTPTAVPVVESIRQLTDDGEQKLGAIAMLATDGSRVYFNEGSTGGMRLAQVSVTGGRTAMIDDGAADSWLQGISPDGSALIAFLNPASTLEFPAWSIPIPAGEPHRLGDMAVFGVTYFPDGRLLLIKGAEIFIADKDGSNARKLATLDKSSWFPDISPDGKRIVVSTEPFGKAILTELAADGSVPPRVLGEGMMHSTWSADGKYLIYGTPSLQGSDLWVLPMHTGWFRRSAKPVRLTTGALLFNGSQPSRDGKQLFTIGNKPRAELVRFDTTSHQFQKFLGGVSAISPTVSADGQWFEYTSYPDHSLWRSRSDGSDRMQLTFPPLEVAYPNISYDGNKVAFATAKGEIYVVSMQGGSPEKVVASHSASGLWSPDGNLLVLTSWHDRTSGGNTYFLQLLDMRTRKLVDVPESEGKVGGAWITLDTIVAGNPVATEFSTFDFKTQKWSHLLSGHFVNWAVTRDGKYLVFTTGGAEPKLQRLRLADRQVETLTSLKDLRRVVDLVEGQTQVSVAADGSAIFARDIGTQEIYALAVKWQ